MVISPELARSGEAVMRPCLRAERPPRSYAQHERSARTIGGIAGVCQARQLAVRGNCRPPVLGRMLMSAPVQPICGIKCRGPQRRAVQLL